jgi:hypothetical protein
LDLAPCGEYGRGFEEKVMLWGSFLLAQWAEAMTFGLAEMNSMLMESVDIRSRHSWSVPAQGALAALSGLGSHGALALAGDGNHVWRDALRARGADVEEHEPHAEPRQARALVVIWPDPQGAGAAGLELVQGFRGQTLVTMGEWAGRTYGAYADGLGSHGQSFSAECQAHVEATYELKGETPLPTWPLARDSLRVWSRRI